MRESSTLRTLCSVLVLALAAGTAGCSDGGGGIAGGECASEIKEGELVITEIYGNSPGADEGNEWFEIYNASSRNLNIGGMYLVKTNDEGESRKEHRMRELVVEPGEYVVVGGILEEFRFLFEYIDYGYGPDLGTLGNTAGRLMLMCGDNQIDRVDYVDLAESKSSQLSGLISPPNAIDNDDFSNFCLGQQASFFQNELGTPGESNEICAPLTQDECVDGMALRAVVKAQPGDVQISEVMADSSAVGDDQGEWLELRINRAIDLNGIQLGRAEPDTEETPGPGEIRQTLAAVECLPVVPGDFVVLVRSTDSAENGGITDPAVSGTPLLYPLNFGLVNSTDGVYVGLAGAVHDVFTYASSGAGTATQISANGGSCPATMPYGDGDLGTPGAEGEICPVDGMCMGTSGMRATNPPSLAGDILISEWMPNPAGSDADKEWLELRSTGSFDMNGVTVAIEGKTTFTIQSSDCLEVNDGDFFVIAESGDSVLNEGLPNIDYVQTSLEFFNSGMRTFSISADATTLDSVTIDISVGSGESVLIDLDGEICEADDSTPLPPDYGTAANNGTPGAANGNCPPT